MEIITEIFVGVDVSKDFLDIAFYPLQKHFRVSNDIAGISIITSKLQSQKVKRIACESSGGYERTMIKALRAAGYKVEVVDSKIVRYFILSKKIKAKTDKIDALMIALYTSCNEPTYEQYINNEKDEELRDLVRIRNNFIEDISREKKRLKQAVSPKSKKLILRHIDFLKQEIEGIDSETKNLIKNNDEWTNKSIILQSIPGIGLISATALIAEMPELGHIENKQAASLLGVAPRVKQSGNYEGVATIAGGRFMIRRILYMAALSASHAKGKFCDYYQRLKSKQKKGKVCLVALMNKMISIANSLVKKGELWNSNFA
jgi:transposase